MGKGVSPFMASTQAAGILIVVFCSLSPLPLALEIEQRDL